MSDSVRPFALPKGYTKYLCKNGEFLELDQNISALNNTIVHCNSCLHKHHNHFYLFVELILWIASALISIIFYLLTYTNIVKESFAPYPTYGLDLIRFLLLILFPFTVVGSMWVIYKIRRKCLITPSFFIIGRNPTVLIQEKLQGTISFDVEGNYQESIINRSGTVTFKTRLTPHDNERFKKYIDKFKIRQGSTINYNAGFILFQSGSSLRFVTNSIKQNQVNTIHLKESFRQPLEHFANNNNWIWQSVIHYKILPTVRQPDNLPIQIVPSIFSEGKNLALALTIQTNRRYFGEKFDLPRVIELKLSAPSSLIGIKSFTPPLLHKKKSSDKIEAVWGDVDLDQGGSNVCYKSFYVTFINPVEEELEIHGSLIIRLEGSISKIEDVQLYYPLGNKRAEKEVYIDQFTDAMIDFKLILKKSVLKKPFSPPPIIENNNLIPNHKTVTELVNQLSSNNIYVQHIIENPPRTNKAHAQTLNRLWDITGRKYIGVYPIDFHLVLSGQEVYIDNKQPTEYPTRGKSKFEIKLHATITEDSVLREKVEGFQKQLKEIIKQLADKEKYSASGT